MNKPIRIGEEKTMTVSEVANALNVSERVIQKHAAEMGLTENGKRTELTEANVTEIKNRIASSGRNDLAHVCELENVTTSLDIEEMTAKVLAYHIGEVKRLREEAAGNAPKVAFYDSVTSSKDAIGMKDAAKVMNLGYGRNILFQKLRDLKIFMDDNRPYQTYIDRGYFRVIESRWTRAGDGVVETHISFKTVVYQRGVDFLLRTLKAEATR